MSVYAPQAETKPARSGDCGCGCGGACGCESRCCDLDCLVRPRFFCGQVLTDADLSATVDWARDRFGLARYRHGWGVVCGLDVTCTGPGGKGECCPDPQSGPTVYINPGYAIDCCGNDLVVCQPMAVTLADACRPLDDPCAPAAQPKPVAGANQPAAGTAARVNPDDCWSGLRQGLFAVSLRLRYHEDLANGQPPIFRSGCSDLSACEYSRVREQPCVHVEVCQSDCSDDEDWKAWQDDFGKKRDLARREIAYAAQRGSEGVLRYLRRYPPSKFCFLENLVCCFHEQESGDASDQNPSLGSGRLKGAARERVAVWLYLDWYLRQFDCQCWSCKPDVGVPLGRVLMQRVTERGEEACRVVMIDESVPHRRPLHKERCRPIPRGAFDLAPYLWQPIGYVSEQLRAAGVLVGRSTVKSESELMKMLDVGDSWLEPDQRTVEALLLKDPFDCERTVGFISGK